MFFLAMNYNNPDSAKNKTLITIDDFFKNTYDIDYQQFINLTYKR
jgi:hypothetical protein